MMILNEVVFEMPTINGSEKQVAWCNDIIDSAIQTIEKNVAREQAEAEKHTDYPPYAKLVAKRCGAWLEVAKAYAAAVSGKTFQARDVIDNRGRFDGMAVSKAYDMYTRQNGIS